MLKQQEKLLEAPLTREDILKDYRLAVRSRYASLIGRREVMSGKAKFGIFGDGKEVAQLAMAKAFRKGDFRSGYYRDQTFMLAIGATDIHELFAQLYAHGDVHADPASAGRQMNAHFSTRSLNPDGSWKNLMQMKNTSPDLSPTGSQMPRLVGLAYASRLYRELSELHPFTQFSNNGNEVAFGTIGNASCAEGVFWEAVNAVGVLKAPMVLSIWDDEYGISVPNEYQITKANISAILEGFHRTPEADDGYNLFTVKGWDYPELVKIYLRAVEIARDEHIPAIIHVTELTQPQGHSTSGSHERYKSEQRLAWEEEFDCIHQMRLWIVTEGIATEEELDQFDEEERQSVEQIRAEAWENYLSPIKAEIREFVEIINKINNYRSNKEIQRIKRQLETRQIPFRKDIMAAVRKTLILLKEFDPNLRLSLIDFKNKLISQNRERYGSHLYSQSAEAATNIIEVKPFYSENSPIVRGYQVINACFDAILERDPRVIAFGEDVGQIGDVNQGFAGLQTKYGKLRVSDTGIREATIVGQAIGLALRGLRPIAEIQYLDYVLYALQIMADDLATLHWRTKGGQKAPVIIRTRGHRLEGVWHSGSPMSGILNLLRGMDILVPRNMTQAAGFYNTLLKSDEPALVVEVLNGYRLKERLPNNIGEFTIPLGVPEILRRGKDVTVVTYGANCSIALETAEILQRLEIETEIIDVRSLLPFDTTRIIKKSLEKTNRIVFLDEDVPGGTTAYMMQEVIENQKGYQWLDSEPRTLSAKQHRPAYGTDGNYWSKPNVEELFETVYKLMSEADPQKYPTFF